MRYRVIGSSNGVIYERDSFDDRERAIEKARALVVSSIGGIGELSTWVWDAEEDRHVTGFRYNRIDKRVVSA